MVIAHSRSHAERSYDVLFEMFQIVKLNCQYGCQRGDLINAHSIQHCVLFYRCFP